ncbi:MAG: OmpH family outer membrane protein [Flavobacteriales bacterium]
MIAKISLSISILLAIAVGYLLMRQPSGTAATNGQEVKVAPALLTEGGPKATVLAYVNGDSLNEKYKFIVEKKQQLEVKMSAAKKRVEKEYRARQDQVEVWKEYMKSNKMSKEDERTMQEDIMRLEQELAEIEEGEMGSLKKDEIKLQTQLLERVNKFLEKFSTENGIDYVLNKQNGLQLMLYGSDAYDITSQVIDGLNKEYEAEQAK